jgi:serine/threonine protein kinase
VHLLGEGGMGAVWKAENVLVRKSVALKLMHGQYAHNESVLARFRNEATAAGRIGNDHICDILDFGKSRIGPYIVMELLQGRSLAEFVAPGPIDAGLAVLIARQALEGLEAAHRAGIIHRDLKPENIFLHEPVPGRLLVKLMDFGISKFSEGALGKTGVGVLMGTPEYMSPEQAEGAAQVDVSSDIWAMGAILYRALTGRDAFLGPTLAATLVAVSTRDPEPIQAVAPHVPEGLAAVVMRCLAKDRKNRYDSAQALSQALLPFETMGSHVAMPRPTEPSSAPGPASMPTPSPTPAREQLGSVDTVMVASGSHTPTQAPADEGAPATADTSWTLGEDGGRERPSSTLSGGRSSFWIVAIVVVLGGVAAAITWMPRSERATTSSGTNTEGTGALAGRLSGTSTRTGSAKAASAHGPGVSAGSSRTDTEAGTASNAAAATLGHAPTTTAAGESGATTTRLDTTAASGQTGTARDDEPDTDGKHKPGTSRRVRVENAKVHRAGGLYTPRVQPGPVGFPQARRHCSRLKRERFAGLSAWRLARASEIARFRDAVAKTLYWTRSGTTYNLFRRTETSARSGTTARPICVSPRK